MAAARYGWLIAGSVILQSALAVLALAQDPDPLPTITLPDRTPINLMAREVPAEPSAPAALSTCASHPAETASPVSVEAPADSWWNRCQARWAGCTHWLHDFFRPAAEAYDQLPLGALAEAHARAQIANGEAALMVLYHYDFVEGQTGLTPHGRERLQKIATLLPENFFPVLIEQTLGNPELDLGRRMAVYKELAQSAFPVPVQRIVIGPAPSYGLDSTEAEIVYRNLLGQTQTRGNLGSTGAGSTGAAGQTFGAAGGTSSGR